MGAQVCLTRQKLTEKFKRGQLNTLSIGAGTTSRNVNEALARIAAGQEVLAYGQKRDSGGVQSQAIAVLKRGLNSVYTDCDPLADDGQFDRKTEQRLARFQREHVANGNEAEVDGIVGSRTLNKLSVVAATNGNSELSGILKPIADGVSRRRKQAEYEDNFRFSEKHRSAREGMRFEVGSREWLYFRYLTGEMIHMLDRDGHGGFVEGLDDDVMKKGLYSPGVAKVVRKFQEIYIATDPRWAGKIENDAIMGPHTIERVLEERERLYGIPKIIPRG